MRAELLAGRAAGAVVHVRRARAPLCGRQLSLADRRVWNQAIAMLMGLQRRNDFGEKELAAAVGTALHLGATKRYCADCGVKVAGGAAINSGGSQGSSAVPLVWRFLITRSSPLSSPQYT